MSAPPSAAVTSLSSCWPRRPSWPEVLSAFRLGDDQAVLDLKAAAGASHARESQARADRQPGSAQGESSQASQANVGVF